MSESTTDTTTTPLAFVLVPIATGVAFLLGGFVTRLDSPVRWALAAAGATLVVLGVFAAYIIARANTYARRIDELEDEASKLREANAGLRSRVVFTLRSPLSAIVGNADRMINAPDLDLQQRQGLLKEIRDNAREVDGVLADLGDVHNGDSNDPRSEGVVLLDQEVRSVISTTAHGQTIEQKLEPSRAWADPALVRQILRTILAASSENGHPDLTVRTQERSDRATVTFSSSEQILPAEGLAALTGNRLISDDTNTTFAALRAANQSAALMRGTIGFAEALGMNHVIVDFERVASEDTLLHIGSLAETVELGPAPIPAPSFTSAVDFRPERPTASIRFG